MQENSKTSCHSDTLNAGINLLAKELRARRRWQTFWRMLLLLFILVALLAFFNATREELASNKPHTAIVDVFGDIFADTYSSADHVVASLQHAFKNPKTRAIVLRINSAGGSPVQAAYIYNAIRELRQQYPDTKVYAVCIDLCASAAYYVGSAADEIYANPMSQVGSIGVVAYGFGFTDAIKKLGIERRAFSSGNSKIMSDPFSPLSAKNKALLQEMLSQVHQHFIHDVRQARGKRLSTDKQVFSGRVWTGEQAKQLGLIDGFASPGQVARKIVKQARMINYSAKPNFFERLGGQLGTQLSGQLRSQLSARSLIGELL